MIYLKMNNYLKVERKYWYPDEPPVPNCWLPIIPEQMHLFIIQVYLESTKKKTFRNEENTYAEPSSRDCLLKN